MFKMASFTIKNISVELHMRLQEAAKAHHRSLNGEILARLESSLGSKLQDTNAMLGHARLLRSEVKGYLTDEALTALKNNGRP
jgi:plasmid stability protein